MNMLMWDLVQSGWVWVPVGLGLLVLVAAVLGDDDADPDDEEDARDDGSWWDRGHDYWVADELGVL